MENQEELAYDPNLMNDAIQTHITVDNTSGVSAEEHEKNTFVKVMEFIYSKGYELTPETIQSKKTEIENFLNGIENEIEIILKDAETETQKNFDLFKSYNTKKKLIIITITGLIAYLIFKK